MTMPNEEPVSARSLPDEYAKLRAPSGSRVLELVGRKWGDRPEGERRELAQILMLILEPLQRPGAEVTDELRAACEQAVTDWIQKTVAVSQLIDSGAHIPLPSSGPRRPKRQVRMVSADAIALDAGHCSARVTLERGARRYTQTVACEMESSHQIRGGASATLGVLRQLLGSSAPFIEIREVGTFEAFDHTGVIVSVAVTEGGHQETLVGVYPDMGQEPVRAAVLAVLNAVNRRLGIG
jgi:hypothetical protein